ncbi:SLC13 family permease [Lacihabitans lacunae]|uniref:SLC13 family permease n=1 Tax=Lacihabitans lacunae TaxID=1028214 RepID=A0ABV7YUA4_9BACT
MDTLVDFSLILVCLVLLGIITILIFNLFDTAITIVAALLILMLAHVISIEEGLLGFSNQGMLTIALLYIIAQSVKQTNVLDKISYHLLGNFNGNYTRALLRMGIPVTTISAFINNTPVVALLIPVIKTWTRSHHIPVSKFLLPLSYFTILGGTCTLIGTSTVLIVHGMLLDIGDIGFTFFEPLKIGGVIVLVGGLYIAFLGYRFLPISKDKEIELDNNTRDFVVALKVNSNFKNLNKSIEEAGLRKLTGLYLFQIERNGRIINAVTPQEKICLRDRLFFTGVPSTIIELQKNEGLELIKDQEVFSKNGYKCFEAVISNGSPLINKLVKNSNFREIYGSVILAIHRHGHRLNQKIGEVLLTEGDTLLLLSPPDFVRKWYHTKDFLLVTESEDFEQKGSRDIYIILTVLLGVILLAVFGILPMFLSAALGVGILFISKIINISESLKAINWKVLVVISASLGISKAVDKVGIPLFLSNSLIAISGNLGFVGVIFSLIAMTMFLSEILNNAAAAAVLFPVVSYLAASTGYPIHAFALALLFGATSSFSTPIGYQTNMMVQGPGSYRFIDYLKIGIPLNLISLFISTGMIYLWYN